jgi:4-aminobutyrate aminotransferase-like enzyme
MEGMRQWAQSHNALLIADEVQSGFGRSGKLFGCDHFGFMPDIMCLAKAVSNGLPLSVVLSRHEILDVHPSLNSTHAGHPLMCAAGLASVDFVLRERLWERAAELGEVAGPRLRQIQNRVPDWISEVGGTGLSWCLQTRDAGTGKPSTELPPRVIEKAFQKGLILLMSQSGPFIKVAPPLVITQEALEEGIQVLQECFDEAVSELSARQTG